MASEKADFKLALVQMSTGTSRVENVARAVSMVTEAAKEGAQMVVLPEIFTSVIDPEIIVANSEPLPGPTTQALAKAAKDNAVYIVGGSIAEKQSDGKIYNSCAIFDPEGKLVGVYRKIHLFDADIPDEQSVRESDIITAGDQLLCFDTPYCKVGVMICYDLRFGELAQLYAQKGCRLLVCPAAVMKTTGELQWQSLMRTRALDQQFFMAMVCQARDDSAHHPLWGHSAVLSPQGTVIAQAEHGETIVYADIDLSEVDKFRAWMPLSRQRRSDIYKLVDMQSDKCGQ